ncbi:MAG: hypothetical protein CVV27_05175 [Candidatus Melainabacteria bacterium HGW-Melainabacteria-1]|nr:MAG: hypothetical protein CVV27_05175 [Candidatus Melainabacteria bacterium HGW-Melainabacteria-1]
MSKDKSGRFFEMGDDDQRPKEKRQSRQELDNLRSQFMDRAKQFMDDTPLGEGRKAIKKFIDKVQGVEPVDTDEAGEWEGEVLPEEAQPRYAESDFEDEAFEDPVDDDGLDWSRPEYIRAGYAKPGTKLERPKTLEEAQEESYSLKMGNLSGLLSRFGSEDAEPEMAPRSGSTHRMEMDKPLFRAQMDQLYAELARQSESAADPRLWLHPEVLTLLRAQNTPGRILLFAMAALFALTDENYLTQADMDWIHQLMSRAGFVLEAKDIQRIVEQTFVFPERVHRLYETLLADPPQISPAHFEQYRENLSKLYIYEVAGRYNADPRNVIRTLASHWQDAATGLQQALAQIAPLQEQYARFQQRKLASATVFQKLRKAEEGVLEHFEHMREIARELEALKQVTRLIEEEDALARLAQFRTELVLEPDERLGEQAITLYDLRNRFVAAQISSLAGPALDPASTEAVELSPIEQKHAIARAKEGELKSLKLIENYKAWRVACGAMPSPQAPAGDSGRPSVDPATRKAQAMAARASNDAANTSPLPQPEAQPEPEADKPAPESPQAP